MFEVTVDLFSVEGRVGLRRFGMAGPGGILNVMTNLLWTLE